MPPSPDQLAAWVAETPARGRLVVPTPPQRELPDVAGLLAGAAEVDITPPPGMPKSGHSKNAVDGIGFRTRLKARVVHLRAGRASVALVACDLHAGSALVHRLVADAVAGRTDVPLAGLVMGATHTHAGPGQFHGSDFYNRWASNRPGMDPAFVVFLVERIAGAVVEAVATREPATAAVGTTEVWGATRNRSLEAHVRNAGTTDRRTEPQRRYAAVNPELHLLRVDSRRGPLAALATFSVHGTGISRLDPSYNADVWAYLVGELRGAVAATTGTTIVAGAIEGTHGDMTPAVTPGLLAYPEAERVGRLIGAAAGRLHADLEAALSSQLDLRAGLVEVDLDTDPVLGGVRLPPAAVGTAKIAGAEENATPLLDRLPPFSPNHPKPFGRGPHGPKWVLGGRIQRRVIPPESFPRVLPVQVVRFGPTTLVGVPFEVTVAAGRRLAAAVSTGRVVVSSVVNDYCDYLTTPEEYALQRYEGASTIYGPQSLAFVTAAAIGLSRRLEREAVVQDVPEVRVFDNRLHRYLPDAASGRTVTASGRPRFVEATVGERAHWEARFTAGGVTWHEPIARVERLDPSGPVVVADDEGWHLGVCRSPDGELVVRWYGPPLGAPVRHRIVTEGVAGPAFD